VVGWGDVVVSDGFIFGVVEGNWGLRGFVALGRPEIVALGVLTFGVGLGARERGGE
jgi:hypothetical protein